MFFRQKAETLAALILGKCEEACSSAERLAAALAGLSHALTSLHVVLWCISVVASTFTTENRHEHCYHLLETGNEKSTKICILQLFMFFSLPIAHFYRYGLAFSLNL